MKKKDADFTASVTTVTNSVYLSSAMLNVVGKMTGNIELAELNFSV